VTVVVVVLSADRRAAAAAAAADGGCQVCTTSMSVSVDSCLPVTASQQCNHLTLYPTTSPTDAQINQLLNSAGQIQQFPAAAVVDVLRMSSVGPSLLLTPTHSLLTTPPAVRALQPMSICVAASDCNLNAVAATQQLLAVQHDQLQLSVNAPLSLLPCSNVNALLTTAAFQTHFLPSYVQPVIGCECVAGQRVIGCECCDSPMTGVVCLQSPPLASH